MLGFSSGLQTFADVTAQQMMTTYQVNVVAPLMLTKALHPLLKKASCQSSATGLSVSNAAVINISSDMASLTNASTKCGYPYPCSKAAVNMITRLLGIDLGTSGILVTSIHPGWVETDMGGTAAPLTSDQSATEIIDTLQKLGDEHQGGYYTRNGEQMAW